MINITKLNITKNSHNVPHLWEYSIWTTFNNNGTSIIAPLCESAQYIQVYLKQLCMFTNRSTLSWHVQSPSIIMATVWCNKTDLDNADSSEGYGWAFVG